MTSLTRLTGKSPRQAPPSRLNRRRTPGRAWRIDISVEPDWFNIATHCVDLDPSRPERRRWSDALRRLPRENARGGGAPAEGLHAEPDAASILRQEREDGLIGGSFFYSLFHDGLTGRNHLWSHERRGFVSSWAVSGSLFPAAPASVWEIRNRYCLLPSATRMTMRLDVVDGNFELAVGCAEHDDGEPDGRTRALARFPLDDTLGFFLQARQESVDVMRRVKRFTPDLAGRLEAGGFDYAAWAVQSGHAACDEQGFDFFGASPSFRKAGLPADQENEAFSSDRVMSHGFLSHYLSVVMRLEFYGP